ncbi:MAG TPA: hypothetical protein PK325_16975 [Cyclobacteriaceae bacterium]|nr:hypothetical protein [Cyclobacteriaceae bacterium]HMV91545.1 hypothetical protein [Cyclobacteriaceae bacterium]HMX00067.1 hypothetical protein [Cyclobacteriaceae bacterium]HMX49071.1 hypothetical protein [Cyclobacteriaceae bacterium]HMY92887.1 hypothetical protein [Cyclobacteriaceae bacterium]
MKTITNTPETMSTLTSCMNNAVLDGYTETFKVEGKGMTGASTADQKFYGPSDVKINNFYRFEGYSDPNDNSILYLVETSDGRKGTLVDSYGMYSDNKISEFIKSVEEIQKKDKTQA